MQAYEIIDAAVQKRGITVAELARRTEINQELLRRSLIGDRKINADEFVSLCRELNLGIENFSAIKAAV